MQDVSRFRTVGDWYRDHRARVPIQMAAALDQIMREKGISFREAYALAVERGAVVEIAPEPSAE